MYVSLTKNLTFSHERWSRARRQKWQREAKKKRSRKKTSYVKRIDIFIILYAFAHSSHRQREQKSVVLCETHSISRTVPAFGATIRSATRHIHFLRVSTQQFAIHQQNFNNSSDPVSYRSRAYRTPIFITITVRIEYTQRIREESVRIACCTQYSHYLAFTSVRIIPSFFLFFFREYNKKKRPFLRKSAYAARKEKATCAQIQQREENKVRLSFVSKYLHSLLNGIFDCCCCCVHVIVSHSTSEPEVETDRDVECKIQNSK